MFVATKQEIAQILGLVYDEEGVQIRCIDFDGDTLECVLQSGDFEFSDLVKILEIVEGHLELIRINSN